MPTTHQTAQVTMPSDREVEVKRSFTAPRALVYRAYTEPELLQQWMLGPPGWTMPVCEMDVRVGGGYRWKWRSGQDGSEFGFSGTFTDVQPGSRLVHTERFEPGGDPAQAAMGEAIVTVTFVEEQGVTTVTTLMDFGSKEIREAATSTGMTDGMEQSYQALDRWLAERATA